VIFDHRIYTVRPGTLKEQIDLYEKFGYAVQKKHLGEPFGFFLASHGDVKNSYVHIWVYKDEEDRSRKREALYADPDWKHYNDLNKKAGFLLTQEIQLMTAASFFSLP